MESQSEEHLKDIKLAIEFKYLMKGAPGGVYLMPELDNMKRLHGAIFLRRGMYRDGVFRFIMILPPGYNDVDTHPEIYFTPPIFNPLVDYTTGKLDLKADEALQVWQPDKHFIVHALRYLKKIFYLSSFDSYRHISNEDALEMFVNRPTDFLTRVGDEVKESLRRVHEPQGPACTLIFTEPKPAHDVLREKMVNKAHEQERQGLLAQQAVASMQAAVRARAEHEENDDWGTPQREEGEGEGEEGREAGGRRGGGLNDAFEAESRVYDPSNEAEDLSDRY